MILKSIGGYIALFFGVFVFVFAINSNKLISSITITAIIILGAIAIDEKENKPLKYISGFFSLLLTIKHLV